MKKTARNGIGQPPYECEKEWPVDCFVQCGDSGKVFTKGSFQKAIEDPKEAINCLTGKTEHYVTAFFEAFPRNPDTFIRGEGKSIPEAEAHCWDQWQKILMCPTHEFEKRGYTNGYGICKHCKLGMSNKFPVEENDEITQNRA